MKDNRQDAFSEENPKTSRVVGSLMEIFGLKRGMAFAVVSFFILILAAGVVWFIRSAPPRILIMTSGPTGSTFQTNAERYCKILARKNVTLKILPSQGSTENLKRLNDPKFHIDVGFVQGGVTNGLITSKLVSLGSISYEPLLVFYRSDAPVTLLSEFNGKRVAIGPHGSGTRSLALKLLDLNGIKPGGATTLSDLEAEDAAKALSDGTMDAVFMMGDSASPPLIRQLLRSPGIRLLDFAQADGYTRSISYLNKLVLPRGSLDYGKDVPAHDINLVGPTVEILARPSLHPALSDLLLEAAQEVNGKPSLMKRRGEFPAPLEHDFPISPDATRYYKSGKSFFYRSLPFWLASRVNVLIVFVPLVVLALPAFKVLPFLLRLRMSLLIYRWYRELLSFEKELQGDLAAAKRRDLGAELDHIEEAVNRLKVPPSFANQFYSLRGHIQLVRERLQEEAAAAKLSPNE